MDKEERRENREERRENFPLSSFLFPLSSDELDKGDREPSISPQNAGIDAGLKIGGYFFVAFFWLRYSFFLAIFLGAIAGICAGCIVYWWQTTNEPEHSPPEEKKKTLADRTKFLSEFRRKSGLLRSKKQRQKR